MRTVTFARALRQPFVSSDDNRTAGLLLRALKDSSFSVRREAVKALGKLSHAYEYLR
jgi:HEAT repeat protein